MPNLAYYNIQKKEAPSRDLLDASFLLFVIEKYLSV